MYTGPVGDILWGHWPCHGDTQPNARPPHKHTNIIAIAHADRNPPAANSHAAANRYIAAGRPAPPAAYSAADSNTGAAYPDTDAHPVDTDARAADGNAHPPDSDA